MTNQSYIRVLTALELFSKEHLQVKRFASDFPEQLPNFSSETEQYPILFVSPTNSIFKRNQNTFELTIYCYDLVQDGRDNINTILSDTNTILNDLYLWLRDGDVGGLEVLNDINCTPINNALLDYVAGWQMNLTIEADTYNVCEIPFNDEPSVLDVVNNIIYSKYLTCETLSDCSTIIDIENNLSGLTDDLNGLDDRIVDLETDVDDINNTLLKKQDLNTGYINGLILSINSEDNTKFDISSGGYVVKDTQVNLIIYDGIQGITPNYLTTSNITYIGLDEDQDIVQKTSPFTNEERRNICMIGAVIHSNRININVVNQIKAPILNDVNQLHDFIKAVGTLNLDGNIYGPNGANLMLNKSMGTVFGLGINAQDFENPHQITIPDQTGLTFRYRLRNSTEYADRTTIDPANYDLNGVLTPLQNNNKWSVQHINLFQSGLTRVQYGQHQYKSLDEAESKLKTDTFVTESNISENAIFRSYLIIKKNCTNLSDTTQAKFIPVDKWGNVISGSVSLTFQSIIDALGYTPEDVSNKTDVVGIGNTTNYPSTKGVADYVSDVEDNLVGYINSGLDMKQDVLTAFNVGEFMDNELPTKLTPSSNDTLLARDSITNEAVEISLNSLLPNSEIDDRQLQRYWYSMTVNTLNTTLMLVNNTNTFTVSGTASIVSRSGTTYYNSLAMNNYLSATASGSNCGIKNNNQGDGSYLEGFDSSFVFINNDTNVNCETTVGYYGLLSVIPNIPKSTYNTDFVGVGNDVGDTNLSFYCKRNTETPSYTKVDCGSSFPAHTTTDAYILRMQMSRGFNGSGRTLKMTITNIITGAVFSHTFTDSQIPAHTRNIAMVVNRSNRNTGVVTNIRFSKWHQTKYLY